MVSISFHGAVMQRRQDRQTDAAAGAWASLLLPHLTVTAWTLTMASKLAIPIILEQRGTLSADDLVRRFVLGQGRVI